MEKLTREFTYLCINRDEVSFCWRVVMLAQVGFYPRVNQCAKTRLFVIPHDGIFSFSVKYCLFLDILVRMGGAPVTAKMYIKNDSTPGIVWLWFVYAKQNRGNVFVHANRSQTILGVCFGYEFHTPKHVPSIFVDGGICLPVTPL